LRFIADGMLGKLTRWLRLLGNNVEYSSELGDAQLIKTAKRERRILLTRDLELYQQAMAKGIGVFYLDGKTEAENLSQLAKRFNIRLEIDMTKSRCTKCNVRVRPIPKEKVADKIERNTFSYYSEFWECPKCGQIYWQGAHWARIRKTLEAAKENLTQKKRVS
jgi:uncharacterized protein with PIN domain